MMEKKLLRGKEVAEILSVSKAYAYRLMSIGEIPIIRMGDRAIRVRPEDLENYILRCLQETQNLDTIDLKGQN